MEDGGQGPGPGPGPAEDLPESTPAVEDDEGDGDGGFSFPVLPLPTDAGIVPVYPIFGRPPSPPPPGEAAAAEEPETATVRVPLGRLLLEEREFRARQQPDARSASARAWPRDDDDDDEEDASSSAAAAAADEELDGVPPETYCLWAPGGAGGGGQASAPASPRRCRKSGSTGSVLRWRRISDRLVGRSHSDGKEKFVFLAAAPAPVIPKSKEEEEGGGGGKGGDPGGGVAGRQLRYYGRGGGGVGVGVGRRRSYLPYKQELVGLFANVSGLRRSYHPF